MPLLNGHLFPRSRHVDMVPDKPGGRNFEGTRLVQKISLDSVLAGGLIRSENIHCPVLKSFLTHMDGILFRKENT